MSLNNPTTPATQIPSASIGGMDDITQLSSTQLDTGTMAASRLRHEIFDSLAQSAVDRLKFLPEGKLQELITPENIEPELLRAFCNKTADAIKELSRFITSQAKKVFATLVVIKMVPAIERFHKYSVTDIFLPVRCEFKGSIWVADLPHATQLAKVFSERDEIQDFKEKQWLFLAPVFTIDRWEYPLEEDQPLPFLHLPIPRQSASRETLFSKVEQYMLHTDHVSLKGVNTTQRDQSNPQLTKTQSFLS